MSCGARLRKDVFARNVTFDPTGPSGDGRRLWGRFDRESASTMDEYTARARKVYGGWEVTVAGMPDATFIHREPTDELTHEKLAAVLDRSDFRVSLVRDSEGLAPPVFSSPPATATSGLSDALATRYTQAEKLVLLAGLTGGRDSVWSRMPGTVESLAHRGLVEMSRRSQDDGVIESIPLRLSPAGVIAARDLKKSTYG